MDRFPSFWIMQSRKNWGSGRAWPVTFLLSKNKKGKQMEKSRVLKQKLLKGCHQSQNFTVLAIPGHLEFLSFLCRPTMVAQKDFHCSIS